MRAPLVSVIAAVFNGERFLREAIESVLAQTFTDFEFILVNDGSTDGSADVLAECAADDCRICILENATNIGLAASLNLAIQAATGEYLARQDADDVSMRHRLAEQIQFLEENKRVGLLGTAYHEIDEHGARTATHRQPASDTLIRWQMLFHNAFCHSSVVLRRNLLANEPAGYNEHLRFSQDYELWVRLLQRTECVNLTEPALLRRVHPQAATQQHREQQQKTCCEIAKASLRQLAPTVALSLDEVSQLRKWFYNTDGDRSLASREDTLQIRDKLQTILATFVSQTGLDPDDAEAITKRFGSRLQRHDSSEPLEVSVSVSGQTR